MAEKLGIISSLEPLDTGETFDEFPLHVTLMTWFSMLDKTLFLREIQAFAERYSPQVVAGSDEALFGPNADIRVRKLGNASSLYAMHDELLQIITELKGEVWYGGFVASDYLPHVTYQGERGIDEWQEVVLEQVQVISGDEQGPRTVLANFELSKERGQA